MKEMKRALRRFQSHIHQQRRLKEDINQHAHDDGGIPHYINTCPIEEYPEWSYNNKGFTEPSSDKVYIGYPKLTACGDDYSIHPLCPCLYSEKFQYRFKEQPQDKLSTRMVGHGWEESFDKRKINSRLKLKEGIEEYFQLDKIELFWEVK